MTTSGVYTYSVNRDKIIRMAMMNLGKLDETETPTAQEILDCSDFLNALVKQWQGKADFAPGLKTWTRRRGHLFLSNSTGSYLVGPGATGWTENYIKTSTTASAAGGQAIVSVTSVTGMSANDKFGIKLDSGALFWSTISAINSLNITLSANLPSVASTNATVFTYTTTAQQPIVIESVVLRDSTNDDTPIRIMNQADYDFLPTKSDPTFIQDPTAIYYEFQLTNSNLFTDAAAAQDVAKHLVITYLESQQDFVNPTDTPEYPQEWYLPLFLGLSKQIAPMFKAKWTDTMEANFVAALSVAQKKNPERSTMYFQSGED